MEDSPDFKMSITLEVGFGMFENESIVWNIAIHTEWYNSMSGVWRLGCRLDIMCYVIY